LPQADGNGGASFGAGSEAGITGRPKKKKRREEEPQAFTAQREAAAVETKPERVRQVEKATGGLLPTRMTLALSESTASGENLERVSRLIARRVDIDPLYAFGIENLSEYRDPVHGGPLRLASFTRMLPNDWESGVVQSLLTSNLDKSGRIVIQLPQPGRGRGIRGIRVDPGDVSEYMKMLTRDRGAYTLDQAFGIATHLANEGVPQESFRQNLAVVRKWATDTQANLGPDQLVGLASQASKNGVTFTSPLDFIEKTNPDLTRAASEEKRKRAAARLSASVMTGKGGPGTGVTAGILGSPAAFTPILQALASLPADEAAKIIQARYPGYEAEVQGYANVSRELGTQLRLDATSFERSWLNRFFVKPVFGAVERVWDEITGTLYQGAKGVEYWGRLALGDEEGAERTLREGEVEGFNIYSGRKSAAEVLHTDFGIPRAIAVGMEFGLGFAIDPLVILGKGARIIRALRVAPLLEKPYRSLPRFVMGRVAPKTLARVQAREFGQELKWYKWSIERFVGKERNGFRAAMLSDNADDIGTWTAPFMRDVEGRSALPRKYLEHVRDAIRGEVQAGRLAGDALQKELDHALRSIFTWSAPPDSLVRRIQKAYQVADGDARKAALTDIDDIARGGDGFASRGRGDLDSELVSREWLEENRIMDPNVVTKAPGYRTHAQYDAVKKSIDERGFIEPIQLEKTPRGFRVGEGNHRIKIAEELGIEEIPTQIVEVAGVRAGARVEDLNVTATTVLPSEAGIPTVDRPTLGQVLDDADIATEGGSLSVMDLWRAPLRLEVPVRAKPIPLFGMKQWVGSKFVEWGVPGTRLRRLVNINPGNVLKIHEESDRFFRLRSVRARMPTNRVSYYEREAAKAGGLRGVLRERRLLQLVEEMDDEIIQRIAVKHNLPKEVVEDAKQALRGARKGSNEELFGVIEREGGFTKDITKPLTRRQLVNFQVTQDPIEIERTLKRIRSEVDELSNTWKRMGGEHRVAFNRRQALIDAWKNGRDKAVFAWKWGAVGRPAYVMRVILGDETIGRSLATIGSLFERMTAQKLYNSLDAKLLGGKDVGQHLDDWMTDTVKFPDGSEFGIPRTFAHDPRAVPFFRIQEQTGDWMRDVARREKFLVNAGRWGEVNPGEAGYYESWAHVLNNQFAGTPAGDRILRHVSKGNSKEAALADIVHQAGVKDSDIYLERISVGWDKARMEEWASDYVDTLYGYTMAQPGIAKAALYRTIEPDDLKRITGRKPVIHGPLVDLMASKGDSWLRRNMDRWYNTWVRRPEDFMNRQPYTNVFKARSRRTLALMAKDAGVKMDDSMKRVIESVSDEFALAHTKRVMFDFTENSRFGELVGSVAPFMQPFVENIAVWGHLFLRRNPAMVGYVRQLWKLGWESGFLSKDEGTGEIVIPMDWFAFGLPQKALTTMFGGKGWEMVAPLASLNMFYNNTVGIPAGGFDIPVPMPSLAPWAMGPLQMVAADTKSQRLYEWMFQFGPGPTNVKELAASMLPTWIERALGTVFPGLVEGQSRGIEADFLRLQQHLGLDPNEDMARKQARYFAGFRAFFSAFSPATTSVRFPTQALEDEWHRLIEIHDNNYDKALDIFMERYPDNSLITVGKTMVNRQIEGVNIPRMPPTEFATQIIRQPGFAEFFKEFPQWGFALAAGAGSDEFDFDAYASQVTAKDILYKTPERVLKDNEAIEFWQAFEVTRETYDRALKKLEDAGLGEGSGSYDELKLEYSDSLLNLYNKYPRVAPDVIKLDEKEGQVVGATVLYGGGVPDLIREIRVEEVLDSPVFLSTPVGQGTKAYWDMRNRIKEQMEAENFRSLNDTDAEDLKAQYNIEVMNILQQYPAFELAYNAYFDNDLSEIDTPGWRRLRRWKKEGDPRFDQYVVARDALKSFTEQASEADTFAAQSEAYAARREFTNGLIKDGQGAIVKAWWDAQTHGEQKTYKYGMATLPLEFYSRWDLENIAGLTLSEKESRLWERVGRFSLQAARSEAKDVGDASSKFYRARDEFIAKNMAGNPGFAAVVNAANDPATTLRILGFLDQDGKSRSSFYWNETLKVVRYARRVAHAHDWHGTKIPSEFDPEHQRNFQELQDILIKYTSEWRKNDENFNAQWEDIQGRSLRGDPLVEAWLIPDIWFGPIGGKFFGGAHGAAA
jgi:hypothetical protein